MQPEPMDAFLNARVTKTFRNQFNEKASVYGNPSDVLRELARAFVEGRLRVKSPQPTGKELLYEPRIQD